MRNKQRGADNYAVLNLVTSNGGHNKPTQLTDILCLNAVPARNFIGIACLSSGFSLDLSDGQ